MYVHICIYVSSSAAPYPLRRRTHWHSKERDRETQTGRYLGRRPQDHLVFLKSICLSPCLCCRTLWHNEEGDRETQADRDIFREEGERYFGRRKRAISGGGQSNRIPKIAAQNSSPK